jgi:hypothetical protein
MAMGCVSYRVHYAALVNSICVVGVKCRTDAESECGPIGGCGTSSASGQTEMLPHTPQHPPLEFETEAQLSQ